MPFNIKINMKIKIFDNFLNNEDFKDLCCLKLEKIKKNEIKVYGNRIDKFGDIKDSIIPINLLKKIHKNYHQKAINLLSELNLEKVLLYDYSEFHIIETGSKYSFPIHDDTANKLLSGVIYLSPKENLGTVFYKNRKGDGANEIKWKPNRAVFFSRGERETWHSYAADGKSNRIALVYNLMTNNLKEVYRIEKKNFYLGFLRSRINHLLYRFFGILR